MAKNQSKLQAIISAAAAECEAKRRPTFREKLTPEQRACFDDLVELCKSTTDRPSKESLAKQFVKEWNIKNVKAKTIQNAL